MPTDHPTRKPTRAQRAVADQLAQRIFTDELYVAAARQLLGDALDVLPEGPVKERVRKFLARNRPGTGSRG